MIIGLWHPGSGLGDQLFCYLAARITAESLGVPFGMIGSFKGQSFIDLDRGEEVHEPFITQYPSGKIVVDNNWPLYEGTLWYDPEFNFVEDNTIVDGCRLQDERYWESFPLHDWLKVEPLDIPDDVCVIGFRGGEYAAVPDLFLTKDYWDEAILSQRKKGIRKFEVHTDDANMASTFFPDFPIIQDIEINWRSVRYAKHAIIANSAFYVLPRLLSGGNTIAPRYWARRNIKEWSMPQNYYSEFIYI